MRLGICFWGAWGGLGPLLFCEDDLIIVSYIFDLQVVGVVVDFSFFWFVMIWVGGWIVKINLLVLGLSKQLRWILSFNLLMLLILGCRGKHRFWLISDAWRRAFDTRFERVWVSLAVICDSNMRRDNLSEIVRAFFRQRNFDPVRVTLLVYPLDRYRLSAFRLVLIRALTWRHRASLGINKGVP